MLFAFGSITLCLIGFGMRVKHPPSWFCNEMCGVVRGGLVRGCGMLGLLGGFVVSWRSGEVLEGNGGVEV